jgi:pyruvate dehydrogenase E2 component (dihydrolipoamide acetyltransferase)
MATPIEMPQLGNTVEECILTRWFTRAGESVTAGDLIAEIETDKTTFEIAAPVGGTLLATFVEDGALVPVFTNICVIGHAGEDVEVFRPRGAGVASPSSAPQAPTSVTGAETEELATAPSPAVHPGVPTRTRRVAAFSPRASRFAAEHDFHPGSISGTGPGGRVLERDVRREYERTRGERTQELPTHGLPIREPRAREPHATGLRATIARRMRESLASTAQYTMHSSADAAGLLTLRARIKSAAAEGMPDVTINDLVTFCTIQALLDSPAVNAEYIDGRIVQHAEVHIGFAVDTPRGLLAPVVRNAQDLTAGNLALRMKELTTQALEGTIAPDDLTGATFTISNLGSLGIESFTPLINPPQVAILGVGAIQARPVRRKGSRDTIRVRETSARRAIALAEAFEVVDSIGLSLTCDHQVIDGAPGARFLQVLRQKIENVEALTDM